MQNGNNGKVDCGNGKRSNFCFECEQTAQNPEAWCGGDCEWDNFFEECNLKSMNSDEDW